MRLLDRAAPRGGNRGPLLLGLLWFCLAAVSLPACGGAGAPESPAVSAPASGQTAEPEPLTEEERLIAAQLEKIDLEEKTRGFRKDLQRYLEEAEHREIQAGDPIVIDGAVCLPLRVMAMPEGAQAETEAYRVAEFAFRLDTWGQYVLHEGQGFRPNNWGYRALGCATSPDGQWRMETVMREDLVTRLLPYPFSDDAPVWVGEEISGQSTELFWTPDSRHVGIEAGAGVFLFRLEDFSVTQLPGADYFLAQEIPEELYIWYDEGLRPSDMEGARGPFLSDAQVFDRADFWAVSGEEALIVQCWRQTEEIAPFFRYEYHIGTGEVTLLEFGFVQGY